MIDFVDKSSIHEGTPLNRANLMAMQGFISNSIEFIESNGKIVSIVETNSNGETKTTTFNADGSITETFVGEKIITKTTRFSENLITELITEVVS